MFWKNDPNRKSAAIRICLILIVGALLALILILPLRGIMNAVNRIDYITQRLDDYPRMNTVYHQETDEWWSWWLQEVYDQRARQAAYIYDLNERPGSDEEKTAYIAEVLQADKVQIVSQAEYQGLTGENAAESLVYSSAGLADGRLIVLGFADAEEGRVDLTEDDAYFLSQVVAGLPGYICVLRDGALSVYPKDEKEEELRSMISSMLQSGKLDPAGLAEQARQNGEKTALKSLRNSGTGGIPAGKYFLYSAAYADNDDFVINVSDTRTLFRIGRKRSWSLWFLCCAVMVLLAPVLWKTRLYKPGTQPQEEVPAAVKSSISAMFMAVLLIFVSVLVTQMLSGVPDEETTKSEK